MLLAGDIGGTKTNLAVFWPACANAVERGPPAWPAPIIIASYSFIVTCLPSVVLLFFDYLVPNATNLLHIDGIISFHKREWLKFPFVRKPHIFPIKELNLI